MTDPRDTLKRAAEAMHKAALFFAGFLTRLDISNANRSEWEALQVDLMGGCAALDRMAEQEPVYVEQWNHGCNALCTGIDLWIPRCPHCGKPAPNTVKEQP